MKYNPQFAKIGEILVNEGLISQKKLDGALSGQKKSKDKLGVFLVNKGLISEEDLVKAYSMQLGHNPISHDDLLKAPEDIVSLIPNDFSVENNVLALNKTDTSIFVAMEDPEDIATIDAIKKLTKLEPEVLVAGKTAIANAIKQLYDRVKQTGEMESAISNIKVVRGYGDGEEELDLGTENVSAEDAPFVKLVNLILTEAIKEDSSDIHIEPGRDKVTVRIRVDGVLIQIMTPPISSLNGMVTRIKILSKLNIAEHRLPQDGRMTIKTSERDIDVRVSILPTVHGEKVVLRLL